MSTFLRDRGNDRFVKELLMVDHAICFVRSTIHDTSILSPFNGVISHVVRADAHITDIAQQAAAGTKHDLF